MLRFHLTCRIFLFIYIYLLFYVVVAQLVAKGSKLKVVSNFGAGYDTVDVKAATEVLHPLVRMRPIVSLLTSLVRVPTRFVAEHLGVQHSGRGHQRNGRRRPLPPLGGLSKVAPHQASLARCTFAQP